MFIYLFLKFYLFILEREREQGQTERERGGERECQAGPALSVRSPTWGLNSWTVRSWPEPKPTVGHLTDWATQACLNVYLFLREREREREKLIEQGIEDPKRALCWQQKPWYGAQTHKLHDHILDWTLNWLSHPGAPKLILNDWFWGW